MVAHAWRGFILVVMALSLLMGCASVSHFQSPNGLCRLHRELGLRPDVWVLSLENDFSNFNSCLMAADALVKAGRAKNVLVCVGGNWTRFVNYHTPQSISASDGAGAAVVGVSDDASKWEFVDSETVTQSKYYASMYMGPDKVDGADKVELFSKPYFHITEEGIDVEAVGSPAGALAAVAERRFDAALLDLNYARDTTSGGEGLDLLARLRDLNLTQGGEVSLFCAHDPVEFDRLAH